MFHLDFPFVQDAAKNAKDPLVQADQESLEVHMAKVIGHMAIVKMAELRLKLPKLRM